MTTIFGDDVKIDQNGSGAGSPSHSMVFECETAAGTRFITLRAKPYDASSDDYWLEILRHNGNRLARFEDFTYLSGYEDGSLNLSDAGIFCPWLAMFYGPLVIGQTHSVAAGASFDLSALTDQQLLAQGSRIPCYPSAVAGCGVTLTHAFYGLRYEIGDYSGNASVAAPVSVYTMSGETINGVDYSVTPYLITNGWGQVTVQGDDIVGTNWVIKGKV